MAFTAEQQAIELISRAKQILIITKQHAGIDTVASALAMGLWLEKLHKSFDMVIPDFDAKSLPSFLPTTFELHKTIGPMRAFHILLNVRDVSLSELMYDVRDGQLDVTLIPKQGEWSEQDVKFKSGEDRYDLVIALDAPDLHSLGQAVTEHADFFYRTTIINIDASATNEHWGQVNLIDLNAVSTSEILYGWLERWNRSLIDTPLATALLTGMIAKTKSFRTANVTPKTLEAAGALMTLGADREGINHGLWRNRPLTTLKLWGRALARLNQDKDLGFVWTTLSDSDFVEIGASPDALEGVVDELVAYAPEAKIVALIYQQANKILVSLHTAPPFSAAELARPFGGTGSRDRTIFPFQAANLNEATTQIVDRLRSTLQSLKK
ncbi:hypothetical protein EXS71_02325 [Candidatus Uhrbacteria bacterium]|nr:hypothetical protein [Candidatus Uhrbacteria bacterium]